MLNTKQEVIDHVRARYQTVERVNKVKRRYTQDIDLCVYDPSVNGVGCFVAALLSYEDAVLLNRASKKLYDKEYPYTNPSNDAAGQLVVWELLTHQESRDMLAKYINLETIDKEFLTELQDCHDNILADTPEKALAFLEILEDKINGTQKDYYPILAENGLML